MKYDTEAFPTAIQGTEEDAYLRINGNDNGTVGRMHHNPSEEPRFTKTDLANRFNVSLKTIDRWTKRGLDKVEKANGAKKIIAFSEGAVSRFVASHPEIIERASSFSRMTQENIQEILCIAKEKYNDGLSKNEIYQHVSTITKRSIETIKVLVKKHDEENPDNAIFGTQT